MIIFFLYSYSATSLLFSNISKSYIIEILSYAPHLQEYFFSIFNYSKVFNPDLPVAMKKSRTGFIL